MIITRGVYDGSRVKVYIDGAPVASAPSSGNIGYGAGGIAIGRDGNYSGGYSLGSLDEVGLYSRALSAQEVLALYNNPGASSLQAHAAFDEGMKTFAHDSSASGNIGAINGAIRTTGIDEGALGSDEISISAWFCKDANDTTSADAVFSGWRRSSDRLLHEGFGLRFHQNTPDRLDFVLVTKKGSGKKTRRTATYSFSNSVGNWHHVAGTYNKTSGEQKLSVDGLLVDTEKHPHGNTIVPLTYYPDMRIGYSRVDNGYFKLYSKGSRSVNIP